MKYNLPVLNRVSRSITLSWPLKRPLLSSLRHRTSAPTSLARRASTAASKLQFGQPLHETHPHLLKAGERKFFILISPRTKLLTDAIVKVTPGITALEYAQRRSKLASKLPRNAIAIIFASDVKFRSNAVFYEFQQDSNFFYFTGTPPFAEAFVNPLTAHRFQWTRCGSSHRLAIDTTISLGISSTALGKCAGENDHVFHLFVRPKDSKAERWDGTRSGPDAARDVFNADEVRLDFWKVKYRSDAQIDGRYQPTARTHTSDHWRGHRGLYWSRCEPYQLPLPNLCEFSTEYPKDSWAF